MTEVPIKQKQVHWFPCSANQQTVLYDRDLRHKRVNSLRANFYIPESFSHVFTGYRKKLVARNGLNSEYELFTIRKQFKQILNMDCFQSHTCCVFSFIFGGYVSPIKDVLDLLCFGSFSNHISNWVYCFDSFKIHLDTGS